MRAGLVAAACALVTLSGAVPVAAQTPAATPVATPLAGIIEFAGAGLQLPESVLYDPVDDVYLVSSLNGDPISPDDNGFITRLSPDGEVLAERWIDGEAEDVELSAPKGSAIVDDTFYVTDVTVVRQFDRATGAPIGTIEIPGATFLNDLAAGPDGEIYVSDMGLEANEAGEFGPSGTDAVYRIDPDGTVTALVQAPDISLPNGLAVLGSGELVIAPNRETGEVYSLAPDGPLQELVVLPHGSLDGVVLLPDGSLLVSSWALQGVMRIAPDGTVSTMLEGIASPADIGYDSQRHLLLIPDMMQNRILAVPLAD